MNGGPVCPAPGGVSGQDWPGCRVTVEALAPTQDCCAFTEHLAGMGKEGIDVGRLAEASHGLQVPLPKVLSCLASWKVNSLHLHQSDCALLCEVSIVISYSCMNTKQKNH